VRLADLVAPLSPESFLEEHWSTGRPHLSAPRPELVANLMSIDALAGPEALLRRHKQDVRLLGPDSFRSMVSPRAALDLLSEGYNLYITNADETVPEARPLLAELARDLGMAPWQLHLEAFAGVAGGVSSRHYDHDLNFQILLAGEKEWLLEENRHIRNPLMPFHPARDAGGNWLGLMEEAYAGDPDMPRAFDPAHSRTLRAAAGTALFLPRGCWHETRALSDTWSVNVVMRSATLARALGRALEIRLHASPEFRAYSDGVGFGRRTFSAAERERKLDAFRALKRAAAAALDQLTMEEAALAMLSLVGRAQRWTRAAASRAVVESDGRAALDVPGVLGAPLELEADLVDFARALCRLRHAFRWDHLRAIAGHADAQRVHDLVSRLAELGAIEIAS